MVIQRPCMLDAAVCSGFSVGGASHLLPPTSPMAIDTTPEVPIDKLAELDIFDWVRLQ